MIKIAVNQSGSISMVPLNGAQVRTKTGWTPIKSTDKIYLNGQWWEVGNGSVVGEILSPDYTGDLLLNVTIGDGTVRPQFTLKHNGVRWATESSEYACYDDNGCPFIFLEYNNGWCTYCYIAEDAGGDEIGCWIGKGANLVLGANLADTWTWMSGQGFSQKPLSVVITKA